jgi:hypothetical protein
VTRLTGNKAPWIIPDVVENLPSLKLAEAVDVRRESRLDSYGAAPLGGSFGGYRRGSIMPGAM